MKKMIAKLPPTPSKALFLSAYAIALLMAIVPPFYFAASGSDLMILGLPAAVAYWIFDALLVGGALVALYIYEDARGELEEVVA